MSFKEFVQLLKDYVSQTDKTILFFDVMFFIGWTSMTYLSIDFVIVTWMKDQSIRSIFFGGVLSLMIVQWAFELFNSWRNSE